MKYKLSRPIRQCSFIWQRMLSRFALGYFLINLVVTNKTSDTDKLWLRLILYLGFGTNIRSLSASALMPAKPRLYGQPTAKTHPHLMKPGEGKQVFLYELCLIIFLCQFSLFLISN